MRSMPISVPNVYTVLYSLWTFDDTGIKTKLFLCIIILSSSKDNFLKLLCLYLTGATEEHDKQLNAHP